MKYTQSFDPVKKEFILNIKTNLINRYFNNLQGLLVSNKQVPKGLKVIKVENDIARITFPCDQDGNGSVINNGSIFSVSLDVAKMTQIFDTINKFSNSGLRKEIKTTEFIPLSGYGKEKLQVEIMDAVKNKRKLCVIQDYQEFLDMEKTMYNFHEYMIDYGTDEYYDVVILLKLGKLSEVKKSYISKLKYEAWC